MKHAYRSHRFSPETLATIEDANRVIDAYQAKGYRLTLRQLYYQLVTLNLIRNDIKVYKRLVSVINDARWAGLVDWEAIEDRGRETVAVSTWSSPAQIIESAVRSYRHDVWGDQHNYLEVMCEKDAVSNILEPVCRRYRVPFTANRGYASASLMYEVMKRLTAAAEDGKDIAIIYLGDHDPSGMDMDNDIAGRLSELSQMEYMISVKRIALTMDQISLWQPPENPAKPKDSRYAKYRKAHGDSCWELDAIKIEDLESLLENEIDYYIDLDQWDVSMEHEAENLDRLKAFRDDLMEDTDGSDD